MPKPRLDLRKIFVPSDSIAFVVIALGLFIALFLDEMAVRLIGVCIAILGGVALFMMISPRIADLSMQGRKAPRPTTPPEIESETKDDDRSRRQIFDSKSYVETFGADEGSDETFVDKDQGALFPEMIERHAAPPPMRPEPAVTRTRPATMAAPNPAIDQEFSDGESGVRVIGVKKSKGKRNIPEDGELVAQRAARRMEALRKEAAADTEQSSLDDLGVKGEVQLNEDIIIRKKPRTAPEPPATKAPAVREPKNSPVAAPPAADPAPRKTVEEPAEPVAGPTVEAIPPPVAEPVAEPAARMVAEAPAAQPLQNDDDEDMSKKRDISGITIEDFMDDQEILGQDEPRKEFDYLLNRVLQVIRSMASARTAAFFWVNVEKQQLVVESKITDAGTRFIEQRKLPMGTDAVSQIALHGRPEILTAIRPSAELDLLPYYAQSAGTVSFIGVPVYFGGKVVGVLCADSTEEDAYDAITVGFFGQFTKLISGLVHSYTGKFDLLQAARSLDAITQFRNSLRDHELSLKRITRALLEVSVQHMDVSTIGVCLFDADQGAWTITDVRSVSDEYKDIRGAVVDLERSSIGHCLTSGNTVVTSAAPGVVRIVGGEPNIDGAQFVAVPLRSLSHSFGALFVENHASTLTQQDISILETIGDHAGSFVEHLRATELLQAGAMLDPATGILNMKGFEMRLREEFSRAIDFQTPLTVCLIRIDSSRAFDSAAEHGPGRILVHVLSRIQNQLRDYDIIGTIDNSLIAIGLVGTRAQQAHMWTETLRKEIASSIIDMDGKRFSVTVSIGVAESTPRDTWDVLLNNAYDVLAMSQKSTNKVTVFS